MVVMVDCHRPACPETITVKQPHYPHAKPAARYCVICHAELRGDHAVGDLICDCHTRRPYNPRHDPHLDRTVLVLLVNAYPHPLNLLRVLGTDDRYAVRDCVNRWRGRGVTIRGLLHVGYVLGSATVAGGKEAR
jgi:hypothetical protein